MRKSKHMNHGLQMYLLKKYITNLYCKLEKETEYKVDIEGELDGVLDSVDNQLRYSENIEIIKERIQDRGFNIDSIDEEEMIKYRKEQFEFLYKNITLFKNKVFALNAKIQKYTAERNFYERGYKKTLSIWKMLEIELDLIPIEYPSHEKADSLLNQISKEDSFSEYSKRFKNKKSFNTKLNINDPRYKNQIHVRQLSERDLMRSMSW